VARAPPRPACVGQLCGHGFDGYLMAMDHFLEGRG